MNTVIYTFKNKKPIFFERPMFYIIKNNKEYNKLIDSFMDIDAVATPHNPNADTINYPIVLKLQSGFAPNFVLSNIKELKSIKQECKNLIKKIK